MDLIDDNNFYRIILFSDRYIRLYNFKLAINKCSNIANKPLIPKIHFHIKPSYKKTKCDLTTKKSFISSSQKGILIFSYKLQLKFTIIPYLHIPSFHSYNLPHIFLVYKSVVMTSSILLYVRIFFPFPYFYLLSAYVFQSSYQHFP